MSQPQPSSPAQTSQGRPKARLLVIVLNYRTPDLTIDCLRSLSKEIPTIDGARVVVVDNASGDGSDDRIQQAITAEEWGGWVRLVRSERNGGFAAGNNVGIRAEAPARNYLLLNSDTIVRPGAIAYSLGVVEGDPGIGAMSCRLLNADGSTQNVARAFPTPLRMIVAATGLPWRCPSLFRWADTEQLWWDRDQQRRDVDWLGGAFLMVPGDVMTALSGLDEAFFFYGEDIEFCHRVRRLGRRCVYDPGASITHLGGSSSDPSRMNAAARSANAWRGRYLVQRKCYGRAAEWVVRGADVTSYALRLLAVRVRAGRQDRRYQERRAVLRLLCGKLMHAS